MLLAVVLLVGALITGGAAARLEANPVETLDPTRALVTQLKAVYLRKNPDLGNVQTHGPLKGRRCFTYDVTERMCASYKIRYNRLRSSGVYWVMASFWLDSRSPPVDESTFWRRPGGRWQTKSRHAGPTVVPCAIRRAWGRPC